MSLSLTSPTWPAPFAPTGEPLAAPPARPGPGRGPFAPPSAGRLIRVSAPAPATDPRPGRYCPTPVTTVGGQDDPGDPGAGPRLLLLGPVRLWGAAGPRPPKAERSCLEYLAWLLEHPGATAATMARGLCVAEGTRRSNLSRLRAWLGPAADGRPHLPAAYSGQLHLHPGVASDWRHCQLLLQPWGGPGWTGRLVAALGLVRGRPLADVGRGQWTWAEPLRAAMADTLRPAALELSHRALALDDIAAARWAVDRGRAALPEDEALRRQSRRVDRRGGDRLPVNRLTTGLGGRPTPTARPPVAARRLVCPRPAAA